MAHLQPVARVSVHLPVDTVAHKRAAFKAAWFYKYKYGGSTVSRFDRSPFTGTWRLTEEGVTTFYDTPVAILVVDIEMQTHQDTYAILGEANVIDDVVAYHYRKYGTPQIAVYVAVDLIFIRKD